MTYPMEDLLVIDLSQIYNGPYATYLMALAGATVIKVEAPGGEPLRRRGEVGGAGLPYAMLNGCKRSIILDLKTSDGVAALKALAAKADVLVENFSPGVMDRLGVGAEVLQGLNPRLVYASSSGYGRTGPYANYPAMDLTIQAMSGAMQVTGFPDRPPVKAGPAIADFFAGIHLYGAIATALYEREHTGIARRLEVAMQDAIYASLSSNLGMHWFTGGARPELIRTGNRHGGLAESPYNVYKTTDGFIAMICATDAHWKVLSGLIDPVELAANEHYHRLKNRVADMDTIDAIVEAWTRQFSTAEVFEKLMAARVPCAPVRTLDEVMNDPNMHERGALTRISHPRFGDIVVQQSPMRYDGVPLRTLDPSEDIGTSTEWALRTLTDLDPATIDRLTGKAA